jgi:hypothetical protein
MQGWRTFLRTRAKTSQIIFFDCLTCQAVFNGETKVFESFLKKQFLRIPLKKFKHYNWVLDILSFTVFLAECITFIIWISFPCFQNSQRYRGSIETTLLSYYILHHWTVSILRDYVWGKIISSHYNIWMTDDN